VDTLTIEGVYEAGDTVTVTGVATAGVVYTVLEEDLVGDAAADLVAIAAKVAAAVNAAADNVVTAVAAADGTLTLTADVAGTPFTATVSAANVVLGEDDTQAAAIATTTTNGTTTASDSTPTDQDVIINFDTAADKLDLEETKLMNDVAEKTVNGVTFEVASGIATVTDTPDLTDVLAVLATEMGTDKATVAYLDGEDTYIFQGDGVAGLQDSDVLIQLVGVHVTDLGAIIV